jgi:hypothetical protein
MTPQFRIALLGQLVIATMQSVSQPLQASERPQQKPLTKSIPIFWEYCCLPSLASINFLYDASTLIKLLGYIPLSTQRRIFLPQPGLLEPQSAAPSLNPAPPH